MYIYCSLCLFLKCDTFPSHECFVSVQKHVESNEQVPPSESDTQFEVDMTSHQDPQPQVE